MSLNGTWTAFGLTVAAVRFYNHAGFIGAIQVGSETRERWNAAGSAYVRKAGLLYSVGLRHLILAVPVVAGILSPVAGPVAAVLVVAVVLLLDRFDAGKAQDDEEQTN